MPKFYDFNALNIKGKNYSMSHYRGKVVLVVNVASQCAFTHQYEALQKLYERYNEKGLVIIAFPCNQFREQESGTHKAIQKFCQLNYAITFPLFSKIEVNGTETHPLYAFLKQEAKGIWGTESIKWNFTKFLIDRDGNVVHRYAPTSKVDKIEPDIQNLLKEFVLNK